MLLSYLHWFLPGCSTVPGFLQKTGSSFSSYQRTISTTVARGKWLPDTHSPISKHLCPWESSPCWKGWKAVLLTLLCTCTGSAFYSGLRWRPARHWHGEAWRSALWNGVLNAYSLSFCTRRLVRWACAVRLPAYPANPSPSNHLLPCLCPQDLKGEDAQSARREGDRWRWVAGVSLLCAESDVCCFCWYVSETLVVSFNSGRSTSQMYFCLSLPPSPTQTKTITRLRRRRAAAYNEAVSNSHVHSWTSSHSCVLLILSCLGQVVLQYQQAQCGGGSVRKGPYVLERISSFYV